MNKIALMLGLTAVAAGFSACNETWDDNPVMKAPNQDYTDFLNEPELRDTWITIDEDGASTNAALHMTCSQPDYGYAAIANYVVEVSLDNKWLQPFVDGESVKDGDYYSTEYAFTDCAQINPVADEIAECVCKLSGWTDASMVEPEKYQKVYVRLRAYLPENEELTTIYSEAKSFEHIRVTYYAASVPDLPSGIYIRGGLNGWGSGADYEFYTTAKRGIYVLPSVTIPKGDEFKFADANWGDINLGSSASVKVGTAFKLAAGGDNIVCPDEFEGRVILVNKSGAWQALLQKEGTFEPGVYPKF